MTPGIRTKADKRLTWFAGAVVLWGALIFAQLVSLQVIHHAGYLRMARKQRSAFRPSRRRAAPFSIAPGRCWR
jgi:hypothetical protein